MRRLGGLKEKIMNWFTRTTITPIAGRLAIYGYLPRKRYWLVAR